jgi:hypothetical protein
VASRVRLPVLAVAAALVTASCAPPVTVPAAPHAADPLCASVVLALPRDLDGMPRLATGSQATVAWGERADPVVLRCGVEPPPPTTDPCVTVDDGITSVDWVSVEGEVIADGAAEWTFTTYGRDPAVEVVVPASVTATRSTSFLVDLGPAIDRVAPTRACR